MIPKLDFSKFHPLDHRLGAVRCRELPGGSWQHFRLIWTYRWRDRLRWPWRRLVLCPLGKHDFELGWQRIGDQWISGADCLFCPFSRPLTAEEEKRRPKWL